ncbi:MAG: hypothetical protein LKM37_09490 [Bacteroidales bacterium]|jgi:hypothetical protein|nr:hypothetical protein [Bacteroidales bacterium]MCI1733431.1 hypothetical protein [Bacteroidales bacterium]
MKKIIYTKGNIIGKSGLNMALDFYAGVTEDDINKIGPEYDIERVEEDICFSDKNPSLPYVIYCGGSGVVAYNCGNIFININPKDAIINYKNDINEIYSICMDWKNREHNNTFMKLLYLGIFSAYECYIVDTLTGLILGEEINFNKYTKSLKFTDDQKSGSLEKITKSLRKTQVSDAPRLVNLFKKFTGLELEIDLFNNMEKMYDIRNSIVHRGGRSVHYGYSLKNIELTSKEIDELVNACNIIVEAINRKAVNKKMFYNGLFD